MSRARARAIEYARVQSEIERNEAEAKKMEAEARYFNRSIIRNVMKYSIAIIVTAGLLLHFCLDTFKILYELKHHENKELNNQRKELSALRADF